MSAASWFAVALGVVSLLIALLKGLLAVCAANAKLKNCTEKTSAAIAESKIVVQRKKTYYQPVYEYVVDGKTYRRKGALEAQQEHKAGKQVHIQYDPKRPSRIITDMGVGTGSAMTMLIVFGALGVGLIVYGLVAG